MSITKAPNSANGASVPTGTNHNVKGSWVQLTASAPEQIVGIIFEVYNGSTSTGGNRKSLIDIGIGGAGSETVLVANLPTAFGDSTLVQGGNFWQIYVPIRVDAGTRIAVRQQSSLGDSTNYQPRMSAYLVGGSGSKGYRTSTTYGADTSDSGGVTVDPGASANTFGSWIEVDAAISRAIKWMLVIITGRANAAPANAAFAIQVGTGGAGSEVVAVPELTFYSNTVDDWLPNAFSFPIEIAAGTRLSVRAKSSTNDATDRLFDVVIVGFDDKPSSGKGAGGNKGKKGGGGGLNIISPGGANVMNIGNPGLDISFGQ